MTPITLAIASLSGQIRVIDPQRPTRFDGEGHGYGLSKTHGDGTYAFRAIPDSDGEGCGPSEFGNLGYAHKILSKGQIQP